jgi:peptidase S41-like protein
MRRSRFPLLAAACCIPLAAAVSGEVAQPSAAQQADAKLAAAPAPKPAPDVATLAAIPLDANEGRAVAEKLASELTKDFVNPANANDYAAMLRANAAAGRYDQGTRGELAKRLTEDMLALHKDGHLHVELATADGPIGGAAGGKPFPPDIQSSKWIAPGVAYIRPSIFKSTPQEVAAFKAFMEEHRQAKTMIFDLRNHHGGALGEMDVIFSYLFAKKTPLVKMEIARTLFDEQGSPFGDAPTLSVDKGAQMVTTTHFAIPGEATPLRKAKVLLLVSNATGSAAEHFSLAMKSSKRGTLIGEATAGANHFGGPLPLNDDFAVWMPVGRTYDIKTGKDWEGTGIQPDIAVDPKLALVKALEMAGVAPAAAVRLNAGEVPAEPVHRDKVAAR